MSDAGYDERGEAGEEEEDTIGEYQGERNEKKERHGKGRTILPNGDYYEGQYRKNKRHGVGLYIFTKSGARYSGQYVNNLKHGIGTFYYPDGSIYEGEWKKDQKEGYGIYMYANGDVFEGQWRQNVKEGIGYYKYKEMPIKYMGTWRKGNMTGPGQAITSAYRYHGNWSNNLPLGKGVFTFGSESMLRGFYTHKEEEPDTELIKDKSNTEESEVEENNITLPRMIPVWNNRQLTKFEGEKLPVEPRPDEYPESEQEVLSTSDGEYQERIYQQNIFEELSQFDKIYVDEAKFASRHSWDAEIIHEECLEPKEEVKKEEHAIDDQYNVAFDIEAVYEEEEAL